MRLYSWMLALLVASACAAAPKFAELHIHDDFIHADGVWSPDHLTPQNELLPSVTKLECYRHGGTLIVGSDAYCMTATAQIMDGDPAIDVTYYPVLSRDGERIVAADSPTSPIPICIWSQITINLRDKTVAPTDNRKLGKGHEGLNNICEKLPLTENYHLIDTVTEFSRRHVAEHSKSKPTP